MLRFALIIFVALLLNGEWSLRGAAASPRPNVLFLLSDDQQWNAIHALGNHDVMTPNLDRLVTNGFTFTHTFCMGSTVPAVCAPSRAMMLTGRTLFRAVGTNNNLNLEQMPTWPEAMRRVGYTAAGIGKWHNGTQYPYHPNARGFDEYYGTVANTPYLNPPNFIDSRVSPKITPVKDDNFYTTDAYAERAVDWIGKQTKPYFLYLPFNAQHAPLQATKKYLDRFPHITDEKRRPFAAMMSAMDDAVGRVLAKVREMGQEDNTLIFFFSDNGGPTMQTTSKNDPLRGRKATTLEGGTRIPFCAQWKGKIPAGSTYEHPMIQLDILPTVIVAAGGKVDPEWKLDGLDLMPYLTGKVKEPPHPVLYWRFGEQFAIRKGDFKLVASAVDGVKNVKLYNLKDDIGEKTDLAAKMPDRVKELHADLVAWRKKVNAPMPAKR